METIGIIVPTKKRFNEWVKLFGNDNNRYIHLDDAKKCIGIKFNHILKSEDWTTVENHDKIYTEAIVRKVND